VTFPLGINTQGQIVGAYFDSTSRAHAFLREDDVFIPIEIPGAIDSFAFGINPRGQIVGSYENNGVQEHGFVLNDGTFTPVDVPGARITTVYGINPRADLVGTYVVGPLSHGFIAHGCLATSGNLLVRGDFEDYAPPDLGPPGWIADSRRQIAAKSETYQPRSGTKNGACWATDAQDCGMFQGVTAPGTGAYKLTFFANADRDGGLVGAHVNDNGAASSSVAVRGFGNYRMYSFSFNAVAGDTIWVWMYSPPSPGYVVIDDVSLVFQGIAP
jgi:probable HAF family extracellular repeat protein